MKLKTLNCVVLGKRRVVVTNSYKILLGAFKLHSVSDRISIEGVVLSFGSNRLLHSDIILYQLYTSSVHFKTMKLYVRRTSITSISFAR
jgi:hypothetical protein